MERGKGTQSRGKSKAQQHFPSDLFVLGAKSNPGETSKRPTPSGSNERKREGPSTSHNILAKKPKTVGGPTPLGRATTSSPTTTVPTIELWETLAVEAEPGDLVNSILDCFQANHFEKAKNYVCGALKTLKNTKWKPDTVLTTSLICLAKIKPSLFASEHVTQALCSLLRREPQHTFKSKGNPLVSVLAANLLARGYSDSKHWPTTFIKLYVEDAISERVWVDQPECKGFVNNLLTGFCTKPSPPINLLLPDLPPLGLSRPDSPVAISLDDDDDGSGAGGVLDIPVFPRYSKSLDAVEHIVLEIQGNRRQTPESVSRNYLKLLTSSAGILEIRVAATPRLEVWLQNPKLMKPAQELLLAICVNCSTHSTKDIQVIGSLVKIRMKSKALVNFLPTCIKELISVHPENISTLLKHIIYNELSNSRNPSNMSTISVLFQTQSETSALLLAEVFLELLLNRDDYLRPLRMLMREIVRVLRHDINLLAFCRGLIADKRDNPVFRDFDLKERMFCAIIDLLSHACFLGVSPAVNVAARGDKREIQVLTAYHNTVGTIQQETVLWLKDQVPKIYRPSNLEYIHALRKIMFMEPLDAYHKVDMWPPESERSLLFRLASESPLFETTLYSIVVIGVSKAGDHPPCLAEVLDLADQLVKRSAGISSDNMNMISASRADLFDLLLKASTYHPPDSLIVPHGYTPPRLAVISSYWKVWTMMLILGAHNPETLGAVGWETYPTLRMLMEMCITNHFSFPPPTMQLGESSEEWKAQEARLTQRDREAILEYEIHLAAASTKQTITETNSILIPQCMAMEPLAPARKPPPVVLEQLRTLNTSHRIGHLLCRSRHPDFLLDLIQRQGTSQSMPWLADLVENSESSLSHLPVQCLCEFLLSSSPMEKHGKGQQLVAHLQQVLTSPLQDPTAPCEVLEYLLRRLSSVNLNSRLQAIKGLKLVLASTGEDAQQSLADYLSESSWLLHKLPSLPHFALMRPQIISALRQACQVENDPVCIASYIQFLALHACSDPLAVMTLLVQDMAQVIVERSTILKAIMPDGSRDPLRTNTLHSLMLIYYTYLEKARGPRGATYQWTESSDMLLVTWANGDEATFNSVVSNAMLVLLSYGPCGDATLFNHMLNAWFPSTGAMPKAYAVNTSEEVPLIPDWLKLLLVHSGIDRLVEVGLTDVDFKALILFLQSFGIPVHAFSRILEKIDELDPATYLEASYDKHYLLSLVEMQKQRGAVGGDRFLQELRSHEPPHTEPTFNQTIPLKQLPMMPSSIISPSSTPSKFHLPTLSVLFNDICSPKESSASRLASFRKLQKILLVDSKAEIEKRQGVSIILQHLMIIMQSLESLGALVYVLNEDPGTSCLMLRLLWTQLQSLPESFQSEFVSFMQQLRSRLKTQDPALQALLKHITAGVSNADSSSSKEKPRFDAVTKLFDCKKDQIGQFIDHLVSTKPELIGSFSEGEMRMLLFGKPVKRSGNMVNACRPYLLTLLTHRASWSRLRSLVDCLLSKPEPYYMATPILDFLEAFTRNPRLWQGREKHVPKHQVPEPILDMTRDQVLCLIEFIIIEAEEKIVPLEAKPGNDDVSPRPAFLDVLETRLPLLLESINKDFFPSVVKNIAENADQLNSNKADVLKHLLVLLYFHVPGIIHHLSGTQHEPLLKGAVVSGWSSSILDKISHTLLTALTSTTYESKDNKKSLEYELAARKMAVVHPALVLRQLPMIAASLQGRVHLDYHVLRNRNHINVFRQVLGIMELLQPRVFAKEYTVPFHVILDTFLVLLKQHGHMKDVLNLVSKFVTFLQNYVVFDASTSAKYLQSNSQSLMAIQRIHPNLTTLRSLLSGILTMREDSSEDMDGPQPSMVVSAPMELPTQPSPSLIAALSKTFGEELLPALQELEHLSLRNPAILEAVSEQLAFHLMSPYSNVRSLAHTLFARLLKHNPQCNALSGYLRCLGSGQGDIVQTALEKLPEIVVSAQEHAVVILEKVFTLAVRSNVGASAFISKAIAQLNQQRGC